MTLLSLHRRDELYVENDGVNGDGLGVYALASQDETGTCLHVWNYSKQTARVSILLQNAPATTGQSRYYVLDARNNNVLTAPNDPGRLRFTDAAPLTGRSDLRLELEPYAHALWLQMVSLQP
ncbi:MAG TPA: hypothetical protein VGN72_17390 [Tepidisphaeraceae bacterium]|jgi:hypothetical protein|nr:hypothetical protein [Tepidisphaeraceae bacterium]